MIHEINVKDNPKCPIYTMLKSGIKKIEGRAYDKKRKNYAIGDRLLIKCEKQILIMKIKDLRLYADVNAFLRAEGFKNALPHVNTYEEALNLYVGEKGWYKVANIENYREKNGFGFVAIEVVIEEF